MVEVQLQRQKLQKAPMAVTLSESETARDASDVTALESEQSHNSPADQEDGPEKTL